MVDIQEILDVDNLTRHIANGNITERFHPEFPELVIYNYADNVQYDGLWDHETMTARGLIVNLDTQEVLARPFKKFFNWNQPEAPDLTPYATREVFYVANKEDGSLGIAYERPDGEVAIATRGSFTSEQADHANEWLVLHPGSMTHHYIEESLDMYVTPLFEIIYPENRIVLNYGDDDYLQWLGGVGIDNGRYYPPYEGPATGHQTLVAAINDRQRENKEGWVVWLNPSEAVKIKQDDYLELHKVVTGLNRKAVWRAVSAGYPEYRALVEALPDEFHEYVDDVAQELYGLFADIMVAVDDQYNEILDIDDVWYIEHDMYEPKVDRKRFAEEVKVRVPAGYQGYMFSLMDGRDIAQKIWKSIEPLGGVR